MHKAAHVHAHIHTHPHTHPHKQTHTKSGRVLNPLSFNPREQTHTVFCGLVCELEREKKGENDEIERTKETEEEREEEG